MNTENSSGRNSLRRRLKSSKARQRVRESIAYRRTKTFLKRLGGEELWLRPEVNPTVHELGDWAVCPDLLPRRHATIYSFGVGDEIDFDRQLIERFAAVVHGFDPTPGVTTWIEANPLPDGFHFYPWAIFERDATLEFYPRLRTGGSSTSEMYTFVREAGDTSKGVAVEAKRLATIMRELGHDFIDVLKMDIEGAEYEVLSDLVRSDIRPTQILVEFHHRFETIDKSRTRAAISELRGAGYRIAFVAMTGREITFVRS